MLRRVKYILDRPFLEYADIIWENILDYMVTKIENIQLLSARLVTFRNRLASMYLLYKETGWDPL